MPGQAPTLSTVSDALGGRAEQILELLDKLLEHSTLYQWNQPRSGIASFSGNHAWRVSDQGRRARSRLVEDYRRFAAIVGTLLTEQPAKALKDFDKADKTLTRICEQSGSTWHKTTDEARVAAANALARQLELVGDLYDPSEGVPVYVPDTNALLHNPDLDEWTFSGSKRFEIVLLPTVLAELDELKVSHRDPNLRQKSEALIGRIKSYQGRGCAHPVRRAAVVQLRRRRFGVSCRLGRVSPAARRGRCRPALASAPPQQFVDGRHRRLRP